MFVLAVLRSQALLSGNSVKVESFYDVCWQRFPLPACPENLVVTVTTLCSVLNNL